jgi:hypothetical protein
MAKYPPSVSIQDDTVVIRVTKKIALSIAHSIGWSQSESVNEDVGEVELAKEICDAFRDAE